MRAATVGQKVAYHSCAWGWRFGVVIGTHTANIGINASGLDMATVRFKPNRICKAVEDHAIPVFRLDAVPLRADP